MNGLKLTVARASRLSRSGRALAAVAALALFAGLAGCVVSFSGIELPPAAIGSGLVGAAAMAVLGFLVSGSGRVERRVYVGAAGVIVLAGVVLGLANGMLLDGGAQFANALLVRIGERTQDYALPYHAGDEGALVAFCVLAGAAGGLACSLIAQRGMQAPAIAAAVAALAGIVSGWVPLDWWALLLAVGIAACACVQSVLASDAAARSSYAWTLVCVLAVGMLVAGGVGAGTRGASVDTSRADGAISQAIWKMEYGDAVFAMPDGRLSSLGALAASDQVAMDVRVDVPTFEYLRGFVGGKYGDDAWTPVGADVVMGNRDLLYWLDRDGMLGSSQITGAARLAGFEDAAESQLELTTRMVRKPYAYLPYGYGGGARAHMTTDLAQVHSDGSGGQEVSFDPGITRKAYLLQDAVDAAQMRADAAKTRSEAGVDDAGGSAAAEGAESQTEQLRTYLDDDAAYRAFAESCYLDVPDEVGELFGQLYGPAVELTTEQAKIQVLSLLDDTVGYSEDPQLIDEEAGRGGLDGETASFMERFLVGCRSGYSVHYATAAALLMRYYGVPTRYVEGYVLDTDTLDAAAAGGERDGEASGGSDEPAGTAPFVGTYTLTERQAHAWVEYYLDGVGWIPFDVTPGWRNAGFYETTDDAELVDDSQNWSVGEADENTVWTPPEAEQQETEEAENTSPIFGELEFVFVLWPWVLAGFLLTLYLAFFVRGAVLHERLRRFLAQAEDESVAPEESVPKLFSYLVLLVQACGGAPLANAPYAAQGAALEEAGLCSAEQFARAARANDRVLFSSADVGVRATREDALAVLECIKSVRGGLKTQVKPLRRFWQRDVKCLW